jgi:protein-disulfide isomerase
MRQTNSSIRGNAAPIILLVVSLVAVAIGGWFYYTSMKPQPETEAPVVETLPDAVAPEQKQSEMPAAPLPGDETAQTPTEETTAEAVTIDVEKAGGLRAVGDPSAPVKIIEYASLTCSHCASFHNNVYPVLKTKYIDTGKVYFEFREFPLNDPALKATLTARCLPEDKYEGFISALFKTQEQWAGGLDYMQALRQNAKLAGMSDAVFDACQAEPMLKLKVAESMQAAKDTWKISATPTFILNEGAEVISGAQPLEEFERVFRKLTNDAVGAAPAVE